MRGTLPSQLFTVLIRGSSDAALSIAPGSFTRASAFLIISLRVLLGTMFSEIPNWSGVIERRRTCGSDATAVELSIILSD